MDPQPARRGTLRGEGLDGASGGQRHWRHIDTEGRVRIQSGKLLRSDNLNSRPQGTAGEGRGRRMGLQAFFSECIL